MAHRRARARVRVIAALVLVACGTEPPHPVDTAAHCDDAVVEPVDAWEASELGVEEDSGDTRAEDGDVGVAIGDVDGDGWLDVLFAGGAGARLFLNDGAGRLVLVADATLDGAPFPGAHAAALLDLDDDGDLDGFLGREDADDLVIWNDGGVFVSEALAGSEEGSTLTGAFADADADGDLDLYAATAIAHVDADAVIAGEEEGVPDLYYRRDTDGYTLIPDALPAREHTGHTFEGTWLDADGDGDLDVYEANDGGPYIDPNRLLLNDGAGRFTLATGCGCELAMFSMGAAAGDPDLDGDPDLYITDVAGPNYLENLGGGVFADVTLANGSAVPPTSDAMTSWGTTFLDVDGDRCLDLLAMFGQSGKNEGAVTSLDPDWVDGELQPDVLFLGDCAGGFTRRTDLGWGDPARGRAVAAGDLDRDGQPDLVTAGKYFVKTWRVSGGCGEDVVLSLAGPPGNPAGLGARIVARVAGREATQWMLPASAGSSSSSERFIGLAGRAAAEWIEVTWPDGEVTRVEDVPAGPYTIAR